VTSIAYVNVVPQLIQAVPEFEDTYDEHMADFDELLTYILFGDLVRYVLAAYKTGNEELVERALRFLNKAITVGDEDVVTLVRFGFVEDFNLSDPLTLRFIATWPRRLREEASRQGWTAP
jgi:hypothetical protein